MKHVDVTSSNIKSIGYDEQSQTMEIIFKNGGHYSYDKVSPKDHQALMSAKSVGSHHAAHIKDKFRANNITKGKK